jgi:hypothetical protein
MMPAVAKPGALSLLRKPAKKFEKVNRGKAPTDPFQIIEA